MEHAMRPIESHIGKHDNGRDLHPIGQIANRGLKGCRDNLCGCKNARGYDAQEAERIFLEEFGHLASAAFTNVQMHLKPFKDIKIKRVRMVRK